MPWSWRAWPREQGLATGGLFPDDCARPHRAATALHVRRARARHSDHRSAGGAAHAGRYLSRHPHSGGRHRLAIHRPDAGADGRTHHHAVAARADDDGQRHRAHRGDVLQRARHHQGVLPARRRHPARQCADHGDLADAAQADAAEHHAAAHSQLQRLDRSDHPAGAVRLGPLRADARRHRPQHAAHAAGHRSRRRHSPALWRQAAAGADRSRCPGDAGARPCPARTSPMRLPRRT